MAWRLLGKNESTVRVGVASVCLLCHCRWLHNSRLRPPASPSPRRSACLSTGASLLTPPTPAGTFTFAHVQVEKKRRRWIPSPGALCISNGMICTCGTTASLFAAVYTFIHKLASILELRRLISFFFFFKRVPSDAVVVDPVLLLLVAYRAVHERAGAAGARGVLELRFQGSAAVSFFGILLALPFVQRAVSGTLGAGHGAVAVVGRRGHRSQRQLGLQEHRGYKQLRGGRNEANSFCSRGAFTIKLWSSLDYSSRNELVKFQSLYLMNLAFKLYMFRTS